MDCIVHGVTRSRTRLGDFRFTHCSLLSFICYSCIPIIQCSRSAKGFPGGSDGKEFTCNAGDLGSISGSGRAPGEGNGYPLQCSCLENPMDRGAWWAIIHGVAKHRTWLKRLNLRGLYSLAPYAFSLILAFLFPWTDFPPPDFAWLIPTYYSRPFLVLLFWAICNSVAPQTVGTSK